MIIGAILSSSCSEKYINVHHVLTIPENCLFEKFTEAEKDSMTEAVGKKIFLNQQKCNIRQQRINDIIKSHNEAHSTN